MTETIEARNVTGASPCEIWVVAKCDGPCGWYVSYFFSEVAAEENIALAIKRGIVVRKFHLSDQRVDVEAEIETIVNLHYPPTACPYSVWNTERVVILLRDFARALGH